MRHLRLVLAVAEERSLTRAAGRLRLTTSALSHQLRQLEELAGTSMFFRDGRSMRPTPAGETLAEAARNALTVVQNAEERLRRGAEQQPQVVRLCTHCFTGYSWLPAIISKFTERSRGRVEVHISVESTRQPFDALRERTVDLALTLNRPTEPDFAVRSLAEDEMVLLVARTHRLAKQSWVTVSEFAHEHLILHPADIQESQFFREHLAPHGVRPKRFTGIMLTEAIIEMVKAGLGVTVLPRWTAANFLSDRGLVALRVTRGGIFRNWYAVTLKRPDNPQLIADLIAEVAGAIGEKKDAPVPGKRRLASGRRRQKVGRRSRGQAGKKI